MMLSAHQPAYLPWLGYFHKIMVSDVFVILDDVQFEKGSFINRNRIKTAQGAQWLTVPVEAGANKKRICEVRTAPITWHIKHLKSLSQAYGSDEETMGKIAMFSRLVSSVAWMSVSRMCFVMGLTTRLVTETATPYFAGDSNERLIAMCKYFCCDQFFFGANGRDYIDVEAWERAGIEPLFQEFRTPEYPQRHGEFIPDLSAIDALFNVGPEKTRELICSGKIHSL